MKRRTYMRASGAMLMSAAMMFSVFGSVPAMLTAPITDDPTVGVPVDPDPRGAVLCYKDTESKVVKALYHCEASRNKCMHRESYTKVIVKGSRKPDGSFERKSNFKYCVTRHRVWTVVANGRSTYFMLQGEAQPRVLPPGISPDSIFEYVTNILGLDLAVLWHEVLSEGCNCASFSVNGSTTWDSAVYDEGIKGCEGAPTGDECEEEVESTEESLAEDGG